LHEKHKTVGDALAGGVALRLEAWARGWGGFAERVQVAWEVRGIAGTEGKFKRLKGGLRLWLD